MNGNGKVNTWTVVALIVSIVFFAGGIIFGTIKESTAKTLTTMQIEIKTATARVDILERQYAVFENELSHMNRKLDRILLNLEDHGEK
jgi:hypothetical protein